MQNLPKDFYSNFDTKKPGVYLPNSPLFAVRPTVRLWSNFQNEWSTCIRNYFSWNPKHTRPVYTILASLKWKVWFFEINHESNWFGRFLEIELTHLKGLQTSFGLKKLSKNVTTLIFFSVKAEVLLFSNFTSGGHQGGHPSENFGFEWYRNLEKIKNFWNFKLE